MNFKKIEIKADMNSTVKTELLFSIAAARAEKCEILCVDIPQDRARFIPYMEKTLKALKKSGRIQLYVMSSELTDDLTEARYLRNKYPVIVKECDKEAVSLIIKI